MRLHSVFYSCYFPPFFEIGRGVVRRGTSSWPVCVTVVPYKQVHAWVDGTPPTGATTRKGMIRPWPGRRCY